MVTKIMLPAAYLSTVADIMDDDRSAGQVKFIDDSIVYYPSSPGSFSVAQCFKCF